LEDLLAFAEEEVFEEELEEEGLLVVPVVDEGAFSPT
jgi:hypothetical protein